VPQRKLTRKLIPVDSYLGLAVELLVAANFFRGWTEATGWEYLRGSCCVNEIEKELRDDDMGRKSGLLFLARRVSIYLVHDFCTSPGCTKISYFSPLLL
jgi:hypothetical protein